MKFGLVSYNPWSLQIIANQKLLSSGYRRAEVAMQTSRCWCTKHFQSPSQNWSRQIWARVHASNRKPSVDNSFWQTIINVWPLQLVDVLHRVFFRWRRSKHGRKAEQKCYIATKLFSFGEPRRIGLSFAWWSNVVCCQHEIPIWWCWNHLCFFRLYSSVADPASHKKFVYKKRVWKRFPWHF